MFHSVKAWEGTGEKSGYGRATEQGCQAIAQMTEWC